jgi:hypothetical protein
VTRTLSIVGGIYIEECIQPSWDFVMGSAGRAALAVSGILTGRLNLVSYVSSKMRKAADDLAASSGATLIPHDSGYAVSFKYLHSLSTPIIRPSPDRMQAHQPILVEGEAVLRYGMLEGDAIVHADVAVYDPQSAFGAVRFGQNGSTARRLAIVMNRAEAASMTGKTDPHEAAAASLDEGAEVVIVKMGSHGALVATKDRTKNIPAFESKHVWKIGSGDVFSSTFAAYWSCEGLDPFSAAEAASRATAYYCETRSLPAPRFDDLMQGTNAAVTPRSGKVYLAGPFFDLGQRWLVEETRFLLRDLGADVFSPVHDVGSGVASQVVPSDIEGLEAADVVFAILNGRDPGTLFEVGYARKRGIPVVALAQNVTDEDLKMVDGTGCEIFDDYVSALYHAIWRLPAA